MNKVLFVSINARYSHSSLAALYLAKENSLEFTINQSEDYILGEILRDRPGLIAFSVYIWNSEIVSRLVSFIKAVEPQTYIIIGGPEIWRENWRYWQSVGADIGVEGHGEIEFTEILKDYNSGKKWESDCYIGRAPAFFDADYSGFNKQKIAYIEGSRGCYNSCSFCLSGADSIRYKDETRVLQECLQLESVGVSLVKFVDRSFNANPARARRIWKELLERDSLTKYHFEIAADFLTQEDFLILKNAASRFQFEIGVQTANPNALKIIGRKTNTRKVIEATKKLTALGVHTHADLIAGLPGDSLKEFENSFNMVYAARPNALQLGFLKILPGTELKRRAKELGIIYKSRPPYTVLATREINFWELNLLRLIAQIINLFYNSARFQKTLAFLEKLYKSAFELYKDLAQYFEKNNYHSVSQSKETKYNILYDFAINKGVAPLCAAELLKFDMLSYESVRKFPDWISSYYIYDDKKVSMKRALHKFFIDLDDGTERIWEQEFIYL